MDDRKKDNRQRLIDAFASDDFQKKIHQYRSSIELELMKFLEWLQGELKPSQKIFHSPESRIKSKTSFDEKISRKDYIHKWDLSGDMGSIQEEILKGLPDLIGFRITCYFMDDEEDIYRSLEKYYEQVGFQNIQLNFEEGTQQQNGHKIYKVSGLYEGKVSFELQIKAMVHNVWGEVEHKTIYKGRQYAVDSNRQRTVTEEIFSILKASDRQLLALFTHEYTEEDLVFGLFAEQTRQRITDTANTDYLAVHYKSFFEIFSTACRAAILSFVSNALADRPYEKVRITIANPDSKTESLAASIKNEFVEYYLQVQYGIAQELYSFEDYDEFILYLAKTLIEKGSFPEDEDEAVIVDDAFSDEEEFGGLAEDDTELLLDLLAYKLPGARKGRK